MSDFFDLGNPRISNDNDRRIKASLKKNKMLCLFNLPKCHWRDDNIPHLCRLLEENTVLEALWLPRAAFSTQSLTRLCTSLTKNHSLISLSFDKSEIKDAAIDAFCSFIETSPILVLQMGEANFNTEDMCRLLSALGQNKTLLDLSFSHSTFGRESLASLCPIAQNTRLECIDFSYAKFTDRGITAICNGLCSNKVLKSIGFLKSPLTDRAADAIAKFLQQNSTVQELWLALSSFTDQGVVELMASLGENRTLQELDFYDCKLSDTVINDLCKFVDTNTCTEILRFYGCTFSDQAVSGLLRSIKDHPSLQTLDFNDTGLTDVGCKELSMFFSSHRQVVYLKGIDVTDEQLTLALKELVKVENVQKAVVHGDTMEIEYVAFGEYHKVKIEQEVKQPWYKALASRFKLGSGKTQAKQKVQPEVLRSPDNDPPEDTQPISDVPEELFLLDEKYQRAYREACEGGTQVVHQCRVMLVGHEGAGKTSIKRTLLGQSFQQDHQITNAMEIEVNKTKNWSPLTGDEEHAELIAKYITNNIRLQEEKEKDDSASLPVMSSAVSHEFPVSTDEAEIDLPSDTVSEVDEPVSDMSEHPDEGIVHTERPPSLSTTHRDIQLPQEGATGPILQDDGVKMQAIPANVMKIVKQQLRNQNKDGKDDISVDLSFWDSGGQGLFYATTKTFLTKRCVFLLAMDMAKHLDDPVPTVRRNWCGREVLDTGCPQTVRGHLDYWLSCLHTFLPGKDQGPSPSIIIVGTRKDACTEEKVKAFYEDIWKFLKGKAYEKNVQTIISLSNISRDNRDVDKLKQLITDMAKKQSYQLPLTWFQFRDDLMKSCEAPVPRITLDQAIQLGLQHGMSGESDVKAALSFFSEVGDILFFDEPTLHNMIISKPQWLINQLREVLTVPSFHEERVFPNSRRHFQRLDEEGLLHEEILRNVWPDEAREELIQIMMKFALLIETPAPAEYTDTEVEEDGAIHYLVPCLLPLANPDVDEKDVSTSIPPIILLPPDGFIPVGLTSRLFSALVNEDRWRVVERIYGDSSTFLPKGKESSIAVNIRQKQDVIEIHGKELLGSRFNGDFHDSLNVILNRLEAITSSICPLRNFNIGMKCPLCHRKGTRSIIRLGYRGRERHSFMYCKTHRDNCSTSEVSIWLKDARVAHGPQTWFGTEGTDVNEQMLLRMARLMSRELEDERVRLVGPTGLGGFADRVNVMAHIRSLRLMKDDDIQSIEAERTRNRKADMLIKHLLTCSRANLVLFAWLLVQADQVHQLPKSIPPGLKEWLADRQKDDILKVAKNLSAHDSEDSQKVPG